MEALSDRERAFEDRLNTDGKEQRYPSTDDNIFLAVFDFAGIATITTVPEPASFALLAVGLAGLGLFSRWNRS